MKTKAIHTIFSLLLSMVFNPIVHAQTVNLFYVGPATTIDSTFGAGNTFGFTRDSAGVQVPAMTGYRGVFITPANVGQFNAIAPPNMRNTYDSITTASSALHVKLQKVLSLAGARLSSLAVLLIDDRMGLPANATVCTDVINGATIAWPCASNWKDSGSNTYLARVSLGESAANLDIAKAGGFRRWEATIIHEFSHTQMLTDTLGVNKWDNPAAGVSGIAISYGGDKGHWFTEIQADEQQAMDEGLGYFWALEHNPPMATELDSFLNDNNHKFLLGSRSFLTGTSQMWNAPHTVICSGPLPCVDTNGNDWNISLNTSITPSTGSYELRKYKWLDVPGEYVLYNEQMSEAYFYLFHQYGYQQKDTAYNKIFDATRILSIHANQRQRYPAHVANMLANSMEAYARTPAGQQEAANGTLVSSMFAYALYDLLGHFGRTEDGLRREFDINSATYISHTPKPLAFQQYWSHRDQIKNLVCQHLGGNQCLPNSAGNIDIHQAVVALRDYFRAPATILQ